LPHVRVGHRQVRNKREPQREIVEVFLYWGNEETQTIIPYHNEQYQLSIKKTKKTEQNKTEKVRSFFTLFLIKKLKNHRALSFLPTILYVNLFLGFNKKYLSI
ncbi:hypothetical protein ACLSYY_05125, partial [[Pasteurella] aerogenes]